MERGGVMTATQIPDRERTATASTLSSGSEHVSRVACRIFRERGYHATSMRAIASALGMQPAALYYYYPGKEDLLFSIMDAAVDALTLRVERSIDPDARPCDQLRQAMEAHITAIA